MGNFRLLVKQGKRWKAGINIYTSVEDAKERMMKLSKLGIQTKLADHNGKEIK